MSDRFAAAVSDIREELMAGADPDAALAEIATEHVLPLVALRNRATLAYGDLATYRARRIAEASDTAEKSAARREQIAAKASREAAIIAEFFRLHPTAFR